MRFVLVSDCYNSSNAMFREFCRAGLAQEHLTRLQLVIVIGRCLARMVRQRFLKKSPKHVCLLARVCAARHPFQFFRWGWGHYVHHRYHLWRSGELGCADKSARVSFYVFLLFQCESQVVFRGTRATCNISMHLDVMSVSALRSAKQIWFCSVS